MLDLVLIRAYGKDDGHKTLPFGLLSIATYLEKHGFSVEIIDRMKHYQTITKCARYIKKLSPRIIGISAMSSQSRDAILLGKELKKICPAKIIYGGQHFTALPQEGMRFGDAVVRNEGEKKVLQLCKINSADIKGVFEGESLSNLDEIPLPSDEMLKDLYQKADYFSALYKGGNHFSILTSRGCYFKCVFCRKADYDCNVRYHSIEYISDYIEKAVRLLEINACFILDDIFTFNKDRVIRFCDELKKRNLRLEFSCFTHAAIDDFQMYKSMKEVGFNAIQIGVESGNDNVLKALKKGQTVQSCIRTIEIIKKAGLHPMPLFMIGNITDTETTIKDTIELAKRLRAICDYGWFSYAQPFPGSEFREIAKEYGRLINPDPATYWNNRISFVPNGLTKSKMKKMAAILTKVLRPTYPPLRRGGRMNILFISFDYPPLSGGIANVSYQMAQKLNSLGGNVIVVAPKVKGGEKFDRNSRLCVHRFINKFFLRELTLILLLSYVGIRYKVDIIYNLAWSHGDFATFLTSRFLKIPYILHAHGAELIDYKKTVLDRVKYGLIYYKLRTLIFKNAKRILAVSEYTKKILVKLGVDEEKIEIIHNGVDIDRFRPGLDTTGVISKYNLNNKRILLTVSRLDEYKGHDIVIKLMPKLLQKIPNIMYIIVGRGGYREFLENLIKKLNLQQNVIFTGYVDEVSLPLFYNVCDVYTMLTKEMLNRGGLFEGFGLAFLEANSCCKPVIGARTGGISDAIVDGKTGYLVDLDNVQEIADKIIQLLDNSELADRLGREGRQRILREGLTWECIGRKIQDILASESKE